MVYRAELDGLRAFAVLSVLFFHAGFSWASGGFIGVDVFFVLSGFFITHILLSEHNKGTFSTISFYERRARRLLPAFFFVLVCTIFINLLTLTPDKFRYFSESIIPSVGIHANIFFTETSNYFSPSAETFPLLHIWSLSVEEQFYVLFPIALTLCFAIKKATQPLLVCLFLFGIGVSYTLMLIAHDKGYHMWSFFMMPARAWELLAGGVLAWYMLMTEHTPSKLTREIGSFVGAAVLILSTVFLNDDMLWPHHITLLPIIGTMLLIYYGSTTTSIGRILSARFIVFIGVISYSLYLWHQPLFALYRNTQIGKPSLVAMSGLIVLSIVLAWATYIWVESPFRNKKAVSRRKIFTLSVASFCLMFATGYALTSKGEWKTRYVAPSAQTFLLPSRIDRQCVTMPSNEIPVGNKQCRRNPNNPLKIAVLGDSHSNQISLAMSSLYPEIGFQQYTRSACGPAIYFDSKKSPHCQKWTQEAVRDILSKPSIETVFVIYRHSYYVKNETSSLHKENLLTVNSHPISNTEAESRYIASLENMLNQFIKANKKVVLFAPIPELPDDITKLLMPVTIFGHFDRLGNNQASSLTEYQTRHAWLNPFFENMEKKNNNNKFKIVYPTDILCDATTCPYILNGEAMYYDDDHITNQAAKVIMEHVLL